MKKWHRRTLFVLFLGALGIAALGWRPALLADEAEVVQHFRTECDLPETLRSSRFSFTHSIPLATPHRGTWVDTRCSGLQHQHDSKNWDIRVSCENGRMTIHAPRPEVHAEGGLLRLTCFAGIGGVQQVRSPNGSTHTEYLLHISCLAEFTPTFWRKQQQELWVQFITIDVDDEAADMSAPLWAAPTPEFCNRFRMSTTGPEPALPARYCNSPLENAMLRILRTLAACTPETHSLYVPTLTAGAERLCHFATDTPWPDCWGTAAQTARDLAYRLGPTLIYLEQNACFGNKQLIEFINGRHFATIFGENFADAKPQEINNELQGIDIKRINNL